MITKDEEIGKLRTNNKQLNDTNDDKDAELEAANTEVAVLKETIDALKNGLAIKSDNNPVKR